MRSLYEISTQMQNIYDELEDGIGIDEETGEIKPEIIQALTITKNELQEKAIDYGYVIKNFENEIDIYDREINRLKERKKQMQNIKDRIKSILTNAMIEFGIVKLQGKTLSLSFRESESVEVTDERMLEERFVKTEIKTSPDKIAIKNAIKNGEDVQGAMLVKKQNLQIK